MSPELLLGLQETVTELKLLCTETEPACCSSISASNCKTFLSNFKICVFKQLLGIFWSNLFTFFDQNLSRPTTVAYIYSYSFCNRISKKRNLK